MSHSPTRRKIRREALVFRLGGKCARCPATTFLQFDCIQPTGPAHHKLFSDNRLAYYEIQQAEGNLQLLCRKCHTWKTLHDLRVLQNRKVRLAAESAKSILDRVRPPSHPLHSGKNPSGKPPAGGSSPCLT